MKEIVLQILWRHGKERAPVCLRPAPADPHDAQQLSPSVGRKRLAVTDKSCQPFGQVIIRHRSGDEAGKNGEIIHPVQFSPMYALATLREF